MAIRPSHQQRRAWKRKSHQVDARATVGARRGDGGPRRPQSGAVPHDRHSLTQVHVIRNYRRAGSRQAPSHGRIIAADHRAFDSDMGVHGRRYRASDVDDIRRWNIGGEACGRHHAGAVRAGRGRVPLRAGRIEKTQSAFPSALAVRSVQACVHLLTLDLAVETQILQLPPHGVNDQNGVFR